MLSQTGIYALQAVLRLAGHGNARTPASELADELGIPRNYLAKVLQRLARAGMLRSSRGPGGGYRLTVPPESLTVAQVVAPFQELTAPTACLLGGACSPSEPCAAHERRAAWSDAGMDILNQTTLADLLSGTPLNGRKPASILPEVDR
jgi:Rrf2 family nitric oxide-sensitive transcriptional repressor